MSRAVAALFCVLLVAGVPGAAAAQAKKPIKRVPTRGVKGTAQMAGDNGKLGLAYTIGRDHPLNFALTGASYTVARVSLGQTIAPTAADKILVLNYTVQNPNHTETHYGWETLRLTAVDSDGVNREYEHSVIRPGVPGEFAISLKPGQKVAVMTIVMLPAAVSVPKLIVQNGDDTPVLRYDLRGKITGLAAPFADPADPTGATARVEVPAQTNVYYPLKNFDAKVIGGAYTTAAIGDDQPGDGNKFFVATLTIKNQSLTDASYDWSFFAAQVRGSDGEKSDCAKNLLKGARDESAHGTLKPGEEYTVRMYGAIPANVTAKTFYLTEGGDSRVCAFDVSAVK